MSSGTYWDLKGILSEIRSNYNCMDEEEEPYYRALSEAIRIVAQPEKRTEERAKTHACDCISRQAAIDHWRSIIDATDVGDGYDMGFNDGLEFCISDLSTMPSAQPEIEERKEESTQNVPKEDLISRKAAIDALKGLPTWWADEGGYYGGAQPPMEALLDPEDAVSAIENLPSAEPERKTGRWIPQDHNRRNGYVTTTVYFYPKCSECGHSGNYGMNYCPNCGSFNGGADE